MVVFLASRDKLRLRGLHTSIRDRFQSDDCFGVVQFRPSDPREPGPYRVEAQTNPRHLFGDASYPEASARVEIGFEFVERTDHEFYWFNWVESDRNLLLGWHRDDTHPEYDEVHVQIEQGGTTVAREPAQFIDKHPMAVVDARLKQLPDVLSRVEWEGETAVGFDSTSPNSDAEPTP